jgi:phospholipid-binding lipoprotein MlaA
MNRIPYIVMLFVLFLLNPGRALAIAPSMGPHALPAQEEETLTTASDSLRDEESLFVIAEQRGPDREEPVKERSGEQNDLTEESAEEAPRIADPLRPWNSAMYHFNDKFYFWVLKPVTQVYKYVAPEPLRIMCSNFFDNLRAPGRFVNNLLQMKTKAAGNEFVRFAFNSTAGLGGLTDAAKELLHIQKSPADFGQTLGRYGIGQGFYLVWPILGPSSPRDTIGMAGDYFLYPLSYLSFTDISFGYSTGIYGLETVNKTSFQVGDYEAFKEAAIDPYVSLRNAYFQNRKKEVGK